MLQLDAPSPPTTLNVAVTDLLTSIVRLQVRAGLKVAQSPPQLKVAPPVGAAVRVTGVPLVNVAEHTPRQVIPAGLLVTVPAPVPPMETTRGIGGGLNVAVTDWVLETLQVPLPLQPPLQPTKVEPPVGVAVRVTGVVKLWPQLPLVQMSPGGLLVTVPVPVPARLTVTVKGGTGALNVAVTEWLAFVARVQVKAIPAVMQSTPQPPKAEPPVAFAVRLTPPLGKLASQVPGQAITAGLLVTVPVPARLTVTQKVGETTPSFAIMASWPPPKTDW